MSTLRHRLTPWELRCSIHFIPVLRLFKNIVDIVFALEAESRRAKFVRPLQSSTWPSSRRVNP